MLMTNYLNSVIYMLKKKDDYDNENVYIGSTYDFIRRKHSHKNSCNNPNHKDYNMKVYQYIRNNGGWNEFNMIVIENYPCNCKEELVKKEDEIICKINCKLNSNRAKRSKKERYEDNRNKIKEQSKQYYQNNKEKRLKQKKEYYENNKNKVLEQKKEYYQNNQEKIKANKTEKIKCDKCGSEITRNHIARHQKTEKCQNYNK